MEEIVRKSDYDLANARREQLLIGLSYQDITITSGHCLIRIPEDPEYISFRQKERAAFERKEIFKEFDWRWAAGGCAKILRLKDSCVLLTVTRDGGSFKGHDTIGAGLAGSFEEMLSPNMIALREAEEEMILMVGNDILYSNYNHNQDFTLEMRKVAEMNKDLRNVTRNCSLKSVSSEIIRFDEGSDLTVEWKDWKRSYSGIGVFFTPGVKGIDYITSAKSEIDANLSDLVIYDGEVVGTEVLDRVIKAHELTSSFVPTGKILATWKGGQIDLTGGVSKDPMVPHTKWLFDLLKKQKQ